MSTTETCALCGADETEILISGSDNLALCEAHWNRWCWLYIGNQPPCGAHLIQTSVQAT